MKPARALWLCAAPLLASLYGPEQDDSWLPANPRLDDRSCMLCHSGPTKGLARSSHAFLLTQNSANACRSCHPGTDQHRNSARQAENDLLPAGPVLAATCATCHPGQDYAPEAAVHPWQRASERTMPPRPPLSEPKAVPMLPRSSPNDFEWSGLFAAGLRLLDISGSHERFDSDFNLDRGLRLNEFGLRGVGAGGLFDRVEFAGSAIGDPYQSIRGELGRDDLYTSKAQWRQSRYRFRTSGDFHRVDRRDQETTTDFQFDINQNLSLEADFARLSQDGFWLTNRIGNQNLTPLTTVPGVENPRRLDSDQFRIGFSGEMLATSFNLGFGYRDESNRDRWVFARPAQANPAFIESEDFGSRASLRGPELDYALSRVFGPLHVDVKGRYLALDRNINGAGNESGFDVAEFTTTTNSRSKGESRSFVLEGSALFEASESTDLILSWHWLDHIERMDFDQTEVTVFPSLGSSTTVNTSLAQRTSTAVFDGAIEIEQELHESLLVNLGYGFARESLRVPDLENGDNDFLTGRTANDGLIAGFQWRPHEHWSLRGRYSDYGQNGMQLHELADNEARHADGRLRYQREGLWAELFANHRQSRNDISSHRFESNSFGISTSLQPRDDFDLHASYTFAKIDSRTLTNFFFDPDPNPRPTIVGFEGDTQSIALSLRIEPSARVHWQADASYTTTRGSFDVDLLDWRIELGIDTTKHSQLGIQFREIDYQEQAGRDDFAARIVMIYWRQTFGNW